MYAIQSYQADTIDYEIPSCQPSDMIIKIGRNYMLKLGKHINYIYTYDPRSEPEVDGGDLVLIAPAIPAVQPPTAKTSAMYLEHLDFLKRVSTGEHPPITPETASRATEAWRQIWMASDHRMPVPSAGTGPDGEMFYAWNAGRHHLELEIIPGQPAEFFYRDRETGEFWGEDYEVGAPLPAEILSKLTLFQ